MTRRRCEQVQQDPSSYEVCALVPRSLGGFAWQHARPSRPPGSLRVYEVHVGIATAREEVGRWSDLRTDLLPRIEQLGYTALLLLGLQEHGYYASFGYQVGTGGAERSEEDYREEPGGAGRV